MRSIASLSMSGTEPSEAEKDGLEAVRGVVDVADHKRLEPSGKTGEKTGDWRVWMADGCVADVEVTTCTDNEAAGFFHALHRGGLPRVRKAKRLSHRWRVWLSDHSPRWSERHSVAELVQAICDRLELVEAAGGTPEQMAHMAQRELIDPHAFFNGPNGRRAIWPIVRRGISLEGWLADGAPGSGYWYPPLLLDYYNGGPFPLRVGVMDVPEPLGNGNGLVETHGTAGESGAGHGSPAPAIQHCIVDKTKKRQLDGAPDRKWLAVILDGIPGFQLTHQFGPRSQQPHPTLEGISFDYFHEVWAVAREAETFVVLRISDGGARQHRHVITRSVTAVSG